MKRLILAILLASVTTGCVAMTPGTIETKIKADTRSLTGKVFIDPRTGRSIVPEYVEGDKYYIHELTRSGEVFFYK